MPSTFNLVRNSRVWFNQNVNSTTGINQTTVTNTGALMAQELTVLDGFSFSQSTQQQTIQLNEAVANPVRGQRAFNTALDPVDFSFSTYLKPQLSGSDVVAEESVLWNALFSATGTAATGNPTAITVTGITRSTTVTPTATIACSAVALTAIGVSAVGDIFVLSNLPNTVTAAQEWASPVRVVAAPTGGFGAATSIQVEYLIAPNAAASMAGAGGAARISSCAWNTNISTVSSPAFATFTSALSNKNQLQKFGMFFLVDNALYAIDNCVLDGASIDFNLDGIATVNWTGKGTALRYISGASVSGNSGIFTGGGMSGTAAPKVAGNYITNKLSTMQLWKKIGGADTAAGTSYSVALTGGNLTIANNVSYVVPSNLGVVNQPIGYFTGTRSITGNVTAYLRTGTNNTADLLTSVLGDGAETKYRVQLEVGGASAGNRVEFDMNGCVLQVPTVEAADVMSTTINFSAQGFDPAHRESVALNAYDIEKTNEIQGYYYSNTTAS